LENLEKFIQFQRWDENETNMITALTLSNLWCCSGLYNIFCRTKLPHILFQIRDGSKIQSKWVMFKRNKWGNTDGNKEAVDCYMKEIIDKPISRALRFF